MRSLLSFVAMLVLGAVAAGQEAPTVSFKPDKAAYKIGEDIKGTVTVTFAPGLHGYQNPPDPPEVLPVAVRPGEGTVVKSVSYPKGHRETFAGVEAMFYSGTIRIPVVIEGSKAAGKRTINLGLFYQQCDDNMCYIPATIPLSVEVTVEAAAVADPPETGGPTAGDEPPTLRSSPGPVSALLTYPTTQVTPGATFPVTLRLDFGERTFAFQPDGGTPAISVRGTFGTEVVAFTVPAGEQATVGGKRGTAYKGSIEIPLTLKAPNEEGDRKFDLEVLLTLADQQGPFEPQSQRVSGEINVAPASTNSASSPTPASQSTGGTSGGLLGFLNNALEKGNWALIIPAALLTGLALCLTPCVFPMIPVTVSFFSNQGSSNTAGRFSLGLFYALGIAGTYGAVGGLSAAAGNAVGELFTKQWFVLLLAAILVALALSMFDVYEIRLPGFIQKNLKGRSGPVGALIMGLLMGFAAAPCAGALVGAVAVKVAEIGSVTTGLVMFGLIGLGMGLPFMALATASSGAKALPKSGGWLKTTKAVLGLIVLYIAADYVFQGLGLRATEASTQVTWMAVLGAFAAYLLFVDKSEPSRAVTMIKGTTAVALGVLGGLAFSSYQKIKFDEEYARLLKEKGAVATGGQIVGDNINWVLYNEENFAKAVASGKPIMIDGRADWCKICHEMEARVFKTPEGLVALSSVYLMEIDWSTKVPEAYKEMTKKRFNILGLPHVVFMEPGGKNEFSVGNIQDVEELKGYLRRIGAQI